MYEPNQRIKADEGFLLLYHLYRIGIAAKSDLALYRGEKRDRYIQRLITKYIERGYIGETRYQKCRYCYLTGAGNNYLRRQEQDMKNPNGLIDAYRAFYDLSGQEEYRREMVREGVETGARSGGSGAEGGEGREPPDAGSGNREPWGNREPPEGWEPGEREPVQPMNGQRRGKLERLARNQHGETFRAEIRQGGVENFLVGAGVCVYREDKPGFEAFLKILSRPDYAETFLWRMICKRGVYYPRREMIIGGNTFENRMAGVLFTQAGWYVVYNTLDRFSKWYSKIEEDSVTLLKDALGAVRPYRNREAQSLVFAVGRGMVAAMVSGHPYGHDRSIGAPQFISRRRQYLWMTVERMKDLFRTVYLVELNSGGMVSLIWFLRRKSASNREEMELLASGNPERFVLRGTQGGNLAAVDLQTGNRAIHSGIYDLTELADCRRGGGVTAIGFDWMANAISKSLGGKLERFISIETGTDIPFARYNGSGEKI